MPGDLFDYPAEPASLEDHARALLAELDQATGPKGLDDWNLRARALIMFLAVSKLGAAEPVAKAEGQ